MGAGVSHRQHPRPAMPPKEAFVREVTGAKGRVPTAAIHITRKRTQTTGHLVKPAAMTRAGVKGLGRRVDSPTDERNTIKENPKLSSKEAAGVAEVVR